MLNRLKISTTLGIGFAVALLGTLAIGFIGWMGLRDVERGVSDLADCAVVSDQYLAEADGAKSDIMRAVDALMVPYLPDKMVKQSWTLLADAEQRWDEGRRGWEKTPNWPETVKVFNTGMAVAEPWLEQLSKMKDLLQRFEHLTEGSEEYTIVHEKVYREYWDLHDRANEVDKEFPKIRKAMLAQVDAQRRAAVAAGQKANRWSIVVLLLAFGVVLVVSVAVSRFIATTVRSASAEASRVALAVARGELRVRGDPAAVHFEFREIVEGMNELCEAFAASSLKLSRHREELEELVGRRTEELTRTNESLRSANRELEHAHTRLVQSAKMASIGQLAAGVAHEINNPVSYIASNLGELEDRVRWLTDALRAASARRAGPIADGSAEAGARPVGLDLGEMDAELASIMSDTKHGLERVKNIVQALRTFSRGVETRWQVVDIRPGLKSTLSLLRNELERKAVVTAEFGETPSVECLPLDLDQVFMNVLLNAAQAIPDRGTITLRTGCTGEEVWIEVSDTGVGIPPENLSNIFDPFFTTKPLGQGTGLGLSLAYGIVERHHGRIDVDSEVGRGSRFRIWVPVHQSSAGHGASVAVSPGPRPAS